MKPDVYKISINLRKKDRPVVTVAGRGPLGNILRTGGLVPDRESLKRTVEQAFEEFDEFDEFEYARVTQLAEQAMDGQAGEQAHKEEK